MLTRTEKAEAVFEALTLRCGPAGCLVCSVRGNLDAFGLTEWMLYYDDGDPLPQWERCTTCFVYWGYDYPPNKIGYTWDKVYFFDEDGEETPREFANRDPNRKS
jgi:hypothetical protein